MSVAHTYTNRRVGIAAARQEIVSSKTVTAPHSLRRERTQAARNAAARVPATLPVPAIDISRNVRSPDHGWSRRVCSTCRMPSTGSRRRPWHPDS